MTLKLKGLQPELRKGWNLAWYHHLTHTTSVQKLRGLRQKLDALRVQTGPSLSNTRVSDENSSVTKAFHFSKLISTQDLFCIQHATFKATYWNSNPFWLHLIFFMHLMIYFKLNDLEIGKGYNLNSEKVETWHGIIIFLSLFQLKTIFASNLQHSKPHTEISALSDFIWYFSCISSFIFT